MHAGRAPVQRLGPTGSLTRGCAACSDVDPGYLRRIRNLRTDKFGVRNKGKF